MLVEDERAEHKSQFRVNGLGKEHLDILTSGAGAPALNGIFNVYVVSDGKPSPTPLFGEHRVDGDGVVFLPRFSLTPGLTYKAVFKTSWIPGSGSSATVERTFTVPRPPSAGPTVVTQVFPTRDTLPENQLKFYLHFSAPMRRGEAYERLRLLDAAGKEVEMPFLELAEELWDNTGTRLTLFFDPGRIKRGLKPREEIGPALEEGKSYTLVIDARWLDAEGTPLGREDYRKAFKVVAPDDRQPDPKNWKLQPPPAGSAQPLSVVFDEPLDSAMLQRVLTVLDAKNQPVPGRIEVDQQETRWRFVPDQAWPAGEYSLAILTTLEDLAGNSIGRPFEVDVFRPVEKKIESPTVSVAFEVK
jgi:hypothetical protein